MITSGFFLLVVIPSLSDAKSPEYILKHFRCGDTSACDYLSEGLVAEAEVFAQEVGGEACGEAGADAADGVEGFG